MKALHPWLNEVLSPRVGRRGRSAEHVISPEIAGALEEIAGALMESAQQVSSGAIQGALTGFAAGGPTGALVGAGLGALSARKAAAAPTPAAPVTALPTAAVAPPGVNLYAVQLLAALLRPEVIRALVALAIAPNGAPTQVVAGVPVPLGGFTNLVQSLAERAAAEYHRHRVAGHAGESWAEYLDDSGVEATEPGARADALLNLLLIQAESVDPGDDPEEDEIDDEDQVQEMFDIMVIQRLGGQ